MPTLTQVNRAYRAALRQREAAAVADLSRAYAQAWQALSDEVEALATVIAEDGLTDPLTLFHLERYQRLQAQLALVMRQLTPAVEQRILSEQAAAARLGSDAAINQMRAVLGDEAANALALARLPDAELTQLLGFLAPGSPLRASLDRLGDAASQQVRDGLVKGMTLGAGPRQIAALTRDSFGGNLTSALRFSRTAQLYAYRGAAIEHFRAHDDVIVGVVWTAACDATCCAACWALHGQFFTLEDAPQGQHFGCRCSLSPATRGSRAEFERGPDLFDDADAVTQERVLGPAGYRAYQSGALELRDLVGQRDDPTLGTVYQRRSLSAALGSRKAEEFKQAAD